MVLFVMLRMEEMVVVIVLVLEDELRGKTVISCMCENFRGILVRSHKLLM